MRSKVSVGLIGLASAALLCGVASPAFAKCKKFGFTVNDYGKDGPTKDAKDLLDKYINEYAKSQGIAKFTTGTKKVNCELFLNFIVFDEHTCTAEATMCWGDDEPRAKEKPAAEKTPAKKKSAKKED